jgi:REP element-mobilizing transposase RayT
MGQSLVKNYIHIVFSTKNRQPLIHPPVEEELHTYLGGICNNLDCTAIKVGGYTDHIHILCMLSKKIALIKLIEEITFLKMDQGKRSRLSKLLLAGWVRSFFG